MKRTWLSSLFSISTMNEIFLAMHMFVWFLSPNPPLLLATKMNFRFSFVPSPSHFRTRLTIKSSFHLSFCSGKQVLQILDSNTEQIITLMVSIFAVIERGALSMASSLVIKVSSNRCICSSHVLFKFMKCPKYGYPFSLANCLITSPFISRSLFSPVFFLYQLFPEGRSYRWAHFGALTSILA